MHTLCLVNLTLAAALVVNPKSVPDKPPDRPFRLLLLQLGRDLDGNFASDNMGPKL